MKSMAMIAILMLCVGYAAWRLSWLAWSLRGFIFGFVLLGLMYIVIRGDK